MKHSRSLEIPQASKKLCCFNARMKSRNIPLAVTKAKHDLKKKTLKEFQANLTFESNNFQFLKLLCF